MGDLPAADGAGCGAPPVFVPARPITPADLAVLTERVRRRVIRWFRRAGLLDAAAAADMLAWENSGFSVDASVRITLLDRDVPSYVRSLEHLLRYCARPPFALERLSVIRGPDGRIARIRYVLPRHKAASWVGPGRTRKSTRPGTSGVVELSPFEFLDRLADLVPPPRKHRHRYHGVFAPNHKLRRAVTALASGNIGKQRDAATGGQADAGHAAGGCCDANQKPRSHPPAARRPTGASSCRSMTTATSSNRRPTSYPRSTSTASDRRRTPGHDKAQRPPDSERLRADTGKTPLQGGRGPIPGTAFRAGAASGGGSNPLTSRSSVGRRLPTCHWPG